MPSRTILAVDPGFDRVGVAVLSEKDGRVSLIFSECIVTDSKDSRDKRLLAIGSRIDEIIKEWRPKSLAIETLFFNTNITSAIGVAEARGVVIFQAARAGLTLYEYGPQTVKIAVTGYGKASKSQVETMVKKLITIPQLSPKKLDDEIDAIALGITHLASQKAI